MMSDFAPELTTLKVAPNSKLLGMGGPIVSDAACWTSAI